MSRNADLPFKTAGLEFIEFATQAPAALGQVFASLGFKAIARRRQLALGIYRHANAGVDRGGAGRRHDAAQ